jgi:hypothetical protein
MNMVVSVGGWQAWVSKTWAMAAQSHSCQSFKGLRTWVEARRQDREEGMEEGEEVGDGEEEEEEEVGSTTPEEEGGFSAAVSSTPTPLPRRRVLLSRSKEARVERGGEVLEKRGVGLYTPTPPLKTTKSGVEACHPPAPPFFFTPPRALLPLPRQTPSDGGTKTSPNPFPSASLPLQ